MTDTSVHTAYCGQIRSEQYPGGVTRWRWQVVDSAGGVIQCAVTTVADRSMAAATARTRARLLSMTADPEAALVAGQWEQA